MMYGDGGRSERVYRKLLLAYPKRFRDEYGAQMVQTFRDMCREGRRNGGRAGLALLWIRALSDLGSAALAERASRRANVEEVVMRERRMAGTGLVLLLAPLYFVAASLLKYQLGIGLLLDPLEAFLSVAQRRDVFNLVSPVVFLGGLCLALLLNVYAVLRLNVTREDGTIVSTVRLEPRFWNLAVALFSAALLSTLVGYLFLENFTYR